MKQKIPNKENLSNVIALALCFSVLHGRVAPIFINSEFCLHFYIRIVCELKGVWTDHFWIHPSKWSSFWYQMIEIKAPIFLITPVKYDMEQMLSLKVTSENVAKVQKLL